MAKKDIRDTAKHLAVDQPILNDPFKEPTRHWVYDDFSNIPRVENNRRPAHYYFRSRTRRDRGQTFLFSDEQKVDLEPANTIRGEVKKWRKGGTGE